MIRHTPRSGKPRAGRDGCRDESFGIVFLCTSVYLQLMERRQHRTPATAFRCKQQLSTKLTLTPHSVWPFLARLTSTRTPITNHRRSAPRIRRGNHLAVYVYTWSYIAARNCISPSNHPVNNSNHIAAAICSRQHQGNKTVFNRWDYLLKCCADRRTASIKERKANNSSGYRRFLIFLCRHTKVPQYTEQVCVNRLT